MTAPFRTYKNWDANWKRQFLSELKANADKLAPRRKLIPILRQSDNAVFAYVEVSHEFFPNPPSRQLFPNDSWLCDPEAAHEPVVLPSEDSYDLESELTIKKSPNAFTGLKYFYQSSEAWTIYNNDPDRSPFWEEQWRISPRYKAWRSDPNSELITRISLKVTLDNPLVYKLKQIALTWTPERQPSIIIARVNDYDHKVVRNDDAPEVHYVSMYQLK